MVLVGKIWEDNIKTELKEGEPTLDSSGSRQGLVVSSCEHGNEPAGSMKLGEFLD